MSPHDPDLDLVLERHIDAPPELLWRGWTEPELLTRWFTPAPWRTVAANLDLRPGGVFGTTMQSPEGETLPPSEGCYLVVEPPRRLVWTDALTPGWRPSGEAFMTGELILEPEAGGTRYRVRVQHADRATRDRHAEMGFEAGWGKALDQLVDLVAELQR